MTGRLVTRPQEDLAVADFLARACSEPSALVVEGEPGIGKSTLWLAALGLAHERGFRVFSARGAAAESVLAYAALADLLGGIESAVLADLPVPQRLAIDRILLCGNDDTAATDRRAVSAAFLSVLERVGEDSPVLIAIDDLQWLDPSSRHVLGFAARRLSGNVGLLGTVRTDAATSGPASWLQLPMPDAVQRIRLRPLSFGALHVVVSERVGRSFSRPTMLRIHEVSGGNPFYAIELARGIESRPAGGEQALPRNLAELVRARVGSLRTDIRETLLAVASLADPTVELVSQAISADADHLVETLGDAEAKGIVTIDGNRLRFTHPLLAAGVYTDATPAQLRKMHRRLAAVVDQPELRARHLALAATSADSVTLQALDAATESARRRGAPAAAAELLELTVRLGGGTPERLMRLAANHFSSGDTRRARDVLGETIDRMVPGTLRAKAFNQFARVCLHDEGFVEAARLLECALGEAGDDLQLQVESLVMLSYALVNAGRPDAGLRTVEDAVSRAELLGQPDLLSLALGMRVVLRFMRGDGIDEPSLRRALELEDPDADVPLALRASVQHALLLAWSGQVERAHVELLSIQRRCIERGEENELIFIAFHVVLNAVWRGDFTDAALVAEDTMIRAQQLGGDLPSFVAFTLAAAVAAYAGDEDAARRALDEALAAGQRSGSHRLSHWTITILGFLEVSLNNYQAALDAFSPLLSVLAATPDSTEIIAASFVPDAIEAMIQLGRQREAWPLVDALDRNGTRLDRPWMLAVGARCRAAVLAAEGDIEAAVEAVREALEHHNRLAMPFERARTQLLFGQLQSRQRHKDAASATLREALAVFETLNTPLWAARARALLARTNVSPRQTALLTPAEQRVAELSASGRTNRDVAAALFMSPKTVEANLTRIYRKLGIHSRAELGRRMQQLTKYGST